MQYQEATFNERNLLGPDARPFLQFLTVCNYLLSICDINKANNLINLIIYTIPNQLPFTAINFKPKTSDCMTTML